MVQKILSSRADKMQGGRKERRDAIFPLKIQLPCGVRVRVRVRMGGQKVSGGVE